MINTFFVNKRTHILLKIIEDLDLHKWLHKYGRVFLMFFIRSRWWLKNYTTTDVYVYFPFLFNQKHTWCSLQSKKTYTKDSSNLQVKSKENGGLWGSLWWHHNIHMGVYVHIKHFCQSHKGNFGLTKQPKAYSHEQLKWDKYIHSIGKYNYCSTVSPKKISKWLAFPKFQHIQIDFLFVL